MTTPTPTASHHFPPFAETNIPCSHSPPQKKKAKTIIPMPTRFLCWSNACAASLSSGWVQPISQHLLFRGCATSPAGLVWLRIDVRHRCIVPVLATRRN